MRTYLLILFIFNLTSAFSQTNLTYAIMIDFMAAEDQKYCGIVRRVENKETDSINIQNAVELRQACFDKNFLIAKELFDKYGYPGIKKVGYNASQNFWLIVQHMDDHKEFQQQVLDSMTAGLKDSSVDVINWAYLTDRVEINFGRKQVYGTQMMLNNDSTGYTVRPTIDPENLDRRRMSVGLIPMSEYISVMNKRYYGNLKEK